nr:hypothetical protein [uncultured Desulfobacter sp.]
MTLASFAFPEVSAIFTVMVFSLKGRSSGISPVAPVEVTVKPDVLTATPFTLTIRDEVSMPDSSSWKVTLTVGRTVSKFVPSAGSIILRSGNAESFPENALTLK